MPRRDFSNSYSAIAKNSCTPVPVPVDENSEHSTHNENQEETKSNFEFGIVGRQCFSPPFQAKRLFLESLISRREQSKPLLPDMWPVESEIMSPSNISRKRLIGHQIDLKKPTSQMVDFYGVTSIYSYNKL